MENNEIIPVVEIVPQKEQKNEGGVELFLSLLLKGEMSTNLQEMLTMLQNIESYQRSLGDELTAFKAQTSKDMNKLRTGVIAHVSRKMNEQQKLVKEVLENNQTTLTQEQQEALKSFASGAEGLSADLDLLGERLSRHDLDSDSAHQELNSTLSLMMAILENISQRVENVSGEKSSPAEQNPESVKWQQDVSESLSRIENAQRAIKEEQDLLGVNLYKYTTEIKEKEGELMGALQELTQELGAGFESFATWAKEKDVVTGEQFSAIADAIKTQGETINVQSETLQGIVDLATQMTEKQEQVIAKVQEQGEAQSDSQRELLRVFESNTTELKEAVNKVKSETQGLFDAQNQTLNAQNQTLNVHTEDLAKIVSLVGAVREDISKLVPSMGNGDSGATQGAGSTAPTPQTTPQGGDGNTPSTSSDGENGAGTPPAGVEGEGSGQTPPVQPKGGNTDPVEEGEKSGQGEGTPSKQGNKKPKTPTTTDKTAPKKGDKKQPKAKEGKEEQTPKKLMKAKYLRKASEETLVLSEPKRPWYKRVKDFISNHPVATALIGGAIGLGIGFIAGPLPYLHLGFQAAVMGTSSALLGGSLAGVGAGLISSITSKLIGGRKERLYNKFGKMYKKCQRIDKQSHKLDEWVDLAEKQVANSREQQKTSKGILKALKVHRFARHFNRKKLKALRALRDNRNEKYNEVADKALDAKLKLNFLEDNDGKTKAIAGYLQKKRNNEAKFAEGKISKEEFDWNQEDYEDDVVSLKGGAEGITKVGKQKTYDQEAINIITNVKGTKSASHRAIVDEIKNRNSKVVKAEVVEAPYIGHDDVENEMAELVNKGKHEEAANLFNEYLVVAKQRKDYEDWMREQGKVPEPPVEMSEEEIAKLLNPNGNPNANAEQHSDKEM